MTTHAKTWRLTRVFKDTTGRTGTSIRFFDDRAEADQGLADAVTRAEGQGFDEMVDAGSTYAVVANGTTRITLTIAPEAVAV